MKLEFLDHLIETKESLMLGDFRNPFDSGAPTKFRQYLPFEFGELTLSVQASFAHYCKPRKTIEPHKYEAMEIALMRDGEFINVSSVITDLEIQDAVERFSDGVAVYPYVPVILIEMLYQELKMMELEGSIK